MKLVLIHGRAQQGLNQDELKAKWIAALKKGLDKNGLELPSDLKVGFPYYGDLLDGLVNQPTLDKDVQSRGSGGELEAKEKAFFYEFLSEVAEQSQISDAEIDERFEGVVKEKGPLNWEWIHAILKALDDKTPFGNLSVKKFTYDVFMYLTSAGIRKQIDDCVRKEINNSPCVVVGHSLGSVVGYNVLRHLDGINVNKYITVGSPLGLKSIRSKLEVPIMMPECVKEGWFNAYDERDVVALQPLNKVHFNIRPAIINYDEVNNFTDNRHGIEGYLSDKEVASVIYEQLMLISKGTSAMQQP